MGRRAKYRTIYCLLNRTRVMNNLEIEIRMVKVIRKVLSILLIIDGITWLLSHYSRLNVFDISYSVLVIAAGLVFFSSKTGIEKILIRTDEASIFIKWVGLIREKQLLYTDIDRISLSRIGVEIERKGKRSLKYDLDNLDRDQKRKVYDFFIILAKEKSLVLGRHFRVENQEV